MTAVPGSGSRPRWAVARTVSGEKASEASHAALKTPRGTQWSWLRGHRLSVNRGGRAGAERSRKRGSYELLPGMGARGSALGESWH